MKNVGFCCGMNYRLITIVYNKMIHTLFIFNFSLVLKYGNI